MKNAVNQTATRAKNMMVRQARLRYAVNSAGRRHLNALKIRNRATTQNPTAEIFISSRRNDLGDFQSNPSVPHMGTSWVLSPEFHTSRVLKKNPMAPLTGGQTDYGQASKGFLVKFDSGHVGMVQRILGRTATNPKPTRWRNKNGIVEKLYTMSARPPVLCTARYGGKRWSRTVRSSCRSGYSMRCPKFCCKPGGKQSERKQLYAG